MENKILVETSARHIHLKQETFDYLMGKENGEHAELVVRAPLSQPGQYVSTTRLNLVGPDNPKTGKPRIIAGVSILGPLRKEDQVEISATDARTLGVKAPIRQSGDVKGSGACKIVNPENGREVELKEGVIVAKRHIHMTPDEAEYFGVEDNEIVYVRVKTPERETIFGDVVCRVNKNFALAMHIDTDESNACNGSGEVYGQILKMKETRGEGQCCCGGEEGHCCKE